MKTKTLLILVLCIIFVISLYSQVVDSTFGTDGYVPYGATGNSKSNLGTGNNIAVQNDGKILVAIDNSNSNTSIDLMFYTYRYNSDGTPDISFGANGVSKIYAGTVSKSKDVKVQVDGKIVVVGETEYCTGGVCGAAQFIMMRMDTYGVIDSTFGIDGKLLSSDVFGDSGLYAKPERVIITLDDKFLIGGRGISGKPFIARLNQNGTMDNSFGTNGVYADTATYASLVDLTTDNLGNTFGLMLYYNYNQEDELNVSDTHIIKLDENGVLDASFGTDGRRIFNSAAYEKPASIAIRSDNKVVVAGHSQPVYITDFNNGYGETNVGFIIILDPNGSNASILPEGSLTYTLPEDSTTFIHKVVLTTADKMLISGKTITKIEGNYHEKAFIALLDENGILDASFNEVGFMKFDYGLHSTIGSLACFLDMELLPDQKILACGYRNPVVHNTTKSLFLLKLKEVNIDNPTYIDENIDTDDEYTVFPNPALNYISVSNNNDSLFECIITVISINGQVMLTQKFNNQQEILLNVMSFAKGVYFIRIQDEKQTVVKKIMIK
jgi:uncharacterized delta-60 repeat protein